MCMHGFVKNRVFTCEKCISSVSKEYKRKSELGSPKTPCNTYLFGQVLVLCRLINKSVLEWFLQIMCKEYTLSRSTNSTLCFWVRREDR